MTTQAEEPELLSIPDEYKCRLCECLAHKPAKCPCICDAVFCSSCMKKAVAQVPVCPACCCDIEYEREIHVLPRLEKFINNKIKTLQAKCRVCDKTGLYGEIEDHMHRLQRCKDCNKSIFHHEEKTHVSSCPNGSKCPGCGESFPSTSINEHTKVCAETLLAMKRGAEQNMFKALGVITGIQSQVVSLASTVHHLTDMIKTINDKLSRLDQLDPPGHTEQAQQHALIVSNAISSVFVQVPQLERLSQPIAPTDRRPEEQEEDMPDRKRQKKDTDAV